VPYQRVIPIPKGVPFPEAASVLMAYGTSHYALVDRAQLKEGETVLVLGMARQCGRPAPCWGSRVAGEMHAWQHHRCRCASSRLAQDTSVSYTQRGAGVTLILRS
jgi:D-arabinose 1-dehydrogenase-like Zn-dependent alcohol dehydrogenase